MDSKERGQLRAAAVAMFVLALLQLIGLLRYVERLPADIIGIGLFIVTILGMVMLAVAFYARSRTNRT